MLGLLYGTQMVPLIHITSVTVSNLRITVPVSTGKTETDEETSDTSKKDLNASESSEHPETGGGMPKRLGGNIGCKDKTSSWHLNGFLDGSSIGSTL